MTALKKRSAGLVVYDPLPIAFAHGEAQLTSTLGEALFFVRTENEGLAPVARLRALVTHIRTARRLRRSARPVLVLWPLLGWFELLLWAPARGTVHLAVHDPKPLRRQIGLGRFPAWLASRLPVRYRPQLIAHSSIARDAIEDVLPDARVTVLPLPMLQPSERVADADPDRIALVLGQFKPARDLAILEALGQKLQDVGIRGVVAGRGWPPIKGWEVHNAFLSEDEFDSYLRHASCLLLPYQHYFQSGVAVRAIELGTPVVGAEHPFLRQLLGIDNALGIVENPSEVDAWLNAVQSSVKAGSPTADIFGGIQQQWKDWLERTLEQPRDAPHTPSPRP